MAEKRTAAAAGELVEKTAKTTKRANAKASTAKKATKTAAKATTKPAAKATTAKKATTSKASASKKATTAKTTAAKTTAAKKASAAKTTAAKTTAAKKATAAKATAAKPAAKKTTTAKAAAATKATAAKPAATKATTAKKATTRSAAAKKPAAAKATKTATAAAAPVAAATAAAAADAQPATAQVPEQTTAPARKRSSAWLVAAACLLVALIAGAIGLNMRPAAKSAAAGDAPAVEQKAAADEAEAEAEQEAVPAPSAAPDLQLVEAAGLAFNLPTSWMKASESDGRTLFAPSNIEEDGHVSAASYRYPGGAILDDSELDSAVRQYAMGLLEGDGYADVSIASVDARTISGMPAYQVRATATVDADPMEVYTLAVGTNDQLWAVTAGAKSASFAARQSIFDEIMRSLQVPGAAAGAPAATATAATDGVMDVLRSFGEFDVESYSGVGNVEFTAPTYKMPFIMQINHTGSAPFVVSTRNDNHEWIDTLVNSIGAYSGTVSNYLFYGDCAYVAVETEDEWDVTFIPFANVESLVNGGHYAGDGVYLLDSSAVSEMSFSHVGAGTLGVWAFSLDEQAAYDLLLSQSGTFDTTVPWDQPKSIIMVNGEGNWSVSW